MAKLDRLAWPTIEAVFAAVQVFLDPVLREAGGIWAPASWQWLDHSSTPRLTVG
jgi:hypothetical protein